MHLQHTTWMMACQASVIAHRSALPRGSLQSSGAAHFPGVEGVAGRDGFRHRAGASISTLNTLPLPARRSEHADFPHSALVRGHAFAHAKPSFSIPRRTKPGPVHSLSSGKRTYFPHSTFCFRHSHWRSRFVA